MEREVKAFSKSRPSKSQVGATSLPYSSPSLATIFFMRRLFLLFILHILAPVASFLDRDKGLHFFTLPELRSPLHHHLSKNGHGGSRWRALNPSLDGVFPEVHDSHEFVGATVLGFVTLNYSTIVKHTTVQSDDVSSGSSSPSPCLLFLPFALWVPRNCVPACAQHPLLHSHIFCPRFYIF